jgi:divinyl chlorophyllide a 8-vinyl-reductase
MRRDHDQPADRRPKRVLVLGATGTIGRATTRALVRAGHEVTCFLRRAAGHGGGLGPERTRQLLDGAVVRFGDVTDAASLRDDGFAGDRFDVLVSCLASRDGSPKGAWAIDYRANLEALAAAKDAGIGHVILLSAICVQKPRLEFQRAKLAAEQALIESGITYSIVRPTAFFKSLSGQIDRLRRGKPFLVFGDGRLTACKPISDQDLGAYLVGCIDDPSRHDRILPIGGPGPAITPREQGEHLFALLGRPARFKHVPVALLDAIVWSLATMGRVVPALAAKAEFARIGRYYATESMLVLDPETGRYDADLTPSTGTETLFDYYAEVLKGEATVERGEHSVF